MFSVVISTNEVVSIMYGSVTSPGRDSTSDTISDSTSHSSGCSGSDREATGGGWLLKLATQRATLAVRGSSPQRNTVFMIAELCHSVSPSQ